MRKYSRRTADGKDRRPSDCLELNGQGGIRTHETREGPPVFKTGAFNHSATCPGGDGTHAV